MREINKKYILVSFIILLIIFISFTLNVAINKKFIKSYTYVEIENRGYTSSDVSEINIYHSYINKILGYNEWRIAVEFEKEPNIYFWFTYRDKKIIFQGVSSDTLLDKESIIEYSEKFKQGNLLNEYEKGSNELIISKEDVIDIINNVFENEGIDENYINSYIDEKNNCVIVEMKDISSDKQEQFIYDVFSKRTGMIYIKYIKEHSMIEFKKVD